MIKPPMNTDARRLKKSIRTICIPPRPSAAVSLWPGQTLMLRPVEGRPYLSVGH
jgi:hypothetical protein